MTQQRHVQGGIPIGSKSGKSAKLPAMPPGRAPSLPDLKVPPRAIVEPAPAFRTVLGIMSGTSLDGVDFVLVDFDAQGRPGLRKTWTAPFLPALAARLLACAQGKADSWETARLHHELGQVYAAGARRGLGREPIDAAGLHGQTIYHASGEAAATLQLGEPAYLAEALGVPVVNNFRASDIAAGGQGAPLATLFHLRVFGEAGRHVAVQNLGGIGNVTSIDGRGSNGPAVLSFDTGPGNMLIDGAMERLSGGRQKLDRDGRGAAKGKVSARLLAKWMREPFLALPPPKSTGRELFGEHYLAAIWAEMDAAGVVVSDRLASLTEFTAESIVMSYARFLPGVPERVVMCGGGANNRFLVSRIRELLQRAAGRRVEVVNCESCGWPPEAVEGAAFALLARERLLGRPGNLPETTGASRPVLCGQVTGYQTVLVGDGRTGG